MVRGGRRRCSRRSAQMLAAVGADARNGRRGCSQRSTQMLATVDADAENKGNSSRYVA